MNLDQERRRTPLGCLKNPVGPKIMNLMDRNQALLSREKERGVLTLEKAAD